MCDALCRKGRLTGASVLPVLLVLLARPAGARGPVDFASEVKPILAKNCLHCHGPDEATRKAGLRLDVRASAFSDHAGTRAFVAGKPGDSDAYARLTSTDPDERMPPPEFAQKTGKRPIVLPVLLEI